MRPGFSPAPAYLFLKLSNFEQYLSCACRYKNLEGQCADGGRKMLKNILVVEDEPASLELISHFLRKEGYGVSEARDGAEAIELIDNSRFDLVLTDIRMPRLDGVALATHILSRIPTIPIITMTAFPSEDLRPIWGYGIEWLSKPLSLHELQSTVQRALARG